MPYPGHSKALTRSPTSSKQAPGRHLSQAGEDTPLVGDDRGTSDSRTEVMHRIPLRLSPLLMQGNSLSLFLHPSTRIYFFLIICSVLILSLSSDPILTMYLQQGKKKKTTVHVTKKLEYLFAGCFHLIYQDA